MNLSSLNQTLILSFYLPKTNINTLIIKYFDWLLKETDFDQLLLEIDLNDNQLNSVYFSCLETCNPFSMYGSNHKNVCIDSEDLLRVTNFDWSLQTLILIKDSSHSLPFEFIYHQIFRSVITRHWFDDSLLQKLVLLLSASSHRHGQ